MLGLGRRAQQRRRGMIVNGFGFSAAFIFLAACALAALGIYFFAMPESRDYHVPEVEEEPGALVPGEAQA